jgi:hypothetical protein
MSRHNCRAAGLWSNSPPTGIGRGMPANDCLPGEALFEGAVVEVCGGRKGDVSRNGARTSARGICPALPDGGQDTEANAGSG